VFSLLGVFALFVACATGDPSRQPAPAGAAPAATPALADLVITGGVLLDMVADDPDPRPVKAVVIRDGRIDGIIAAGSATPVPQSASTIDAGAGYILPGFFDAHVHFRPWLPDASIWKRASNYYGITTLFDTGPCGEHCTETGQEANEWIEAYKEFMNTSAVPDGPTLYMTGRRIQGPDGTHPLGESLGNRDAIANYLDSLVALGVDGVKVESVLAADLRAVVMEEANARGLPVVGHSRDARESIDAGMKFIEHMWPVTSSIAAGDPGDKFNSPQHDHLMDLDKAPELVRSMVDNGVYLNPTMVGRYGYFADSLRDQAAVDFQSFEFGGLYSDMPERDKDGVRAWWVRAADWDAKRLALHEQGLSKVETFLKLFSEAGGKVLVATDSGEDKLVGIGLHREMKMLADAGITPYRILLGATRWPAEMTYKDESIGTIEAGKQADIVILGSNPAADIGNSQDIRYVIKRGRVLRSPDDCSVITPPVSLSCEAY
jgi:imidazolonepropionase-like amidohydrolase